MNPAEPAKLELYRELEARLAGLFANERSGMANAANTAAALFEALPRLNWAGFYFLQDGGLVLGPFQGKVACVRIALGAGVCGTAAVRRESIVVADVHAFAGHIACDPDSRSEIVVPLMSGGQVRGVLDLDSPVPGRFDEADRAGLAAIADLFVRSSDLDRLAD